MTIEIVLAIVLLLVVFAIGWLATVFGLPGNWLMVVGTLLYSVWGPQDGRVAMALSTVFAIFALATLGEILEFILGAVTARQAGGSRRAAVGALGGGLAGAIAGMFVGVPVPVIGPFISAVFFAAFGAMFGAFAAQRSMPDWQDQRKAWEIGKAAFWGRLGGTFSKVVIGTIIIVVGIAALVAD